MPPIKATIWLLVAVLALLAASVAAAHWLDQKELPEWAQPGRVRWCLCYATPKPQILDFVSEAKQNLLQGEYLEGSPCADLARKLGIRGMTYIPLTWNYDGGKIFDRYPELREAEAMKADGSRLFEYHAGRYTGCYNQPGFRARRMAELDGIAKSAAIFFDSTSLVPCHCYVCRKKFREFCLKNLGREAPLPSYDGVRRTTPEDRAFYRFRIESVVDYFGGIREHLRKNNPPNLICPNLHWENAWHIELIARGVPDIVFFEEEGHPPFRKKFMGYKIAQAASHGKTVGQLIYLPPEVRSERGHLEEDHSNAGLAEQAYHAPLLPEEIMLGVAEAQACNGVYIPAYSIEPATPLLNRTDPIASACLEALKKYYEFIEKHDPLYLGAKPGSDIALLYPIRSQLWHPLPLSEDVVAVADLLTTAGMPFEVIVDDDLDPKLLGRVKVLIVPGATCLNARHGTAIRAYIAGGGRAVISEQMGAYDENGDPAKALPMPEFQSLTDVTELAVGKGHVLYSPGPLCEMPTGKTSAMIRGFCRDARCRVENPSGDVFVNVLDNKALGLTEIHLVNYNFKYTPLRPTAADDDGTQEARTPFVSTNLRAKRLLNIPDPTMFRRPVLRLNGASVSEKGYELVIALNGKDVARFSAAELKSPGWHDVLIQRMALRKGNNEVILRAEGTPNSHPDYFNLAIDRDSFANRSFWSVDNGRTWSSDDLSSFDPGAQHGEYMIRVCEWRDVTQPWPAEQVLDSVKVAAAKDVAVSLKARSGASMYCALLSPDHEPVRLECESVGDRIKVVVPRVGIYEILAISANRKTIDALCPVQP